MDTMLLAGRIVLAAVFAIAGIAKLTDVTGTRQAMIAFGVPVRIAPLLAALIPLVELAIAFALILRASAWWGALGALILLALFCVGIGVNLARGRTPDCHCFGQISSGPIGWETLTRNVALSAVAGTILWQGRGDPGASVTGWAGDLSTGGAIALAAGVLLLAVLAVQGWLLLHLMQQNGRILDRIDQLEAFLIPWPETAGSDQVTHSGLPVGTPAPAFSLPDLGGTIQTLDSLRAAGKPVLLIFSDPGCGPCRALLPDVARWERTHAGRLSFAIVSRGTAAANRPANADANVTTLVLQQDREVATQYQAHGTPSAVLVSPAGAIASPVAIGAEAIRALVSRLVGLQATVPLRAGVGNGHAASNGGSAHEHRPARPPAPGVGEAAPALALPDVDGELVDLESFKGTATMVLFWNPGCGYCKRMLDDIRAWEANPPAATPRLLVVSTGAVEANRALGLRSPIVLDQGFATGRAFGATGTPSAVLIDANGRIGSQVAVGAQAVLALARGQQSPATA